MNLYRFKMTATWSDGATESREGWLDRRTLGAAALVLVKKITGEWFGDQPSAIEFRIAEKPKEE